MKHCSVALQMFDEMRRIGALVSNCPRNIAINYDEYEIILVRLFYKRVVIVVIRVSNTFVG